LRYEESISSAVMNASGKIVMECVIETKASMILQFMNGLRGVFLEDVRVTLSKQSDHPFICYTSDAEARSVWSGDRRF
jgi:hypothetical protein